jgi:hypothetical protein
VPIDKTLCLVDCLDIVNANRRLETYKVTVNPDGIRAVFCHPAFPATGCFAGIAPVVGLQSRSEIYFGVCSVPNLKIHWHE